MVSHAGNKPSEYDSLEIRGGAVFLPIKGRSAFPGQGSRSPVCAHRYRTGPLDSRQATPRLLTRAFESASRGRNRHSQVGPGRESVFAVFVFELLLDDAHRTQCSPLILGRCTLCTVSSGATYLFGPMVHSRETREGTSLTTETFGLRSTRVIRNRFEGCECVLEARFVGREFVYYARRRGFFH